MVLGRHLQRADKIVGQGVDVAAQMLEHAPGVVLDRVILGAAVGQAFFAPVHPGKRRLDAVGRVVRESQANRARGRDRKQVAVAYAVGGNRLLQSGGQARGEVALGKIGLGVKQREGPALAGQRYRGGIRCVAHVAGDQRGHGAAVFAVVAQAQHGQGIAQTGKTYANAPFGGGLGLLLRQRPIGEFQHIVQGAHLQLHSAFKRRKVKRSRSAHAERLVHKARQYDRTQITATVGRQGLLATGVGGADGLDGR